MISTIVPNEMKAYATYASTIAVKFALWGLTLLIASCLLLRVCFKISRWRRRRTNGRKVLAFLHPYCDSGGGGERVLWKMVQAILEESDGAQSKRSKSLDSLNNLDITIYTGDIGRSAKQILGNVKDKFGISYDETQISRINFVYIRSRFLLEAKYYPVATMIGQSLGSILVGLECLIRCCPDYFFDSTGHPFTYPLAKYLSNCDIVFAYVHYPIISKDMIEKVRQQRPDHNNNSFISSSVTVSGIKLLYYKAFCYLFSLAGSCASHVMVNGTWTGNHIASLWNLKETPIGEVSLANENQKRRLVKLYPPCNTNYLQSSSLSNRQQQILSIGQFRPEKDQILQIKAFKEVRARDTKRQFKDVKLVILGSTRHQEDKDLVEKLKKETVDMGLSLDDDVEFVVNATFGELCKRLSQSSIGIHTMWNEHFGISVVEMMAAGLIVVAHNSAGPQMDIVVPLNSQITGYLAESAGEYANSLIDALSLSKIESLKLRERARCNSQRFSDENFIKYFTQEMHIGITKSPR